MNDNNLSGIKETLIRCNSSLQEILDIIKSKVKDIDDIIKYLNSISQNNSAVNNNNIVRLNKLRKDGKCAKCGVFLKKDWSAYWDKVSKKLYCSKHKEG